MYTVMNTFSWTTTFSEYLLMLIARRPAAHPPPHSVAECQFSTNLIVTFDRYKIQTSNWYHFVSLVKAIRITYNKALTDQVMTLIRGIFKFTTSLYDLK